MSSFATSWLHITRRAGKCNYLVAVFLLVHMPAEANPAGWVMTARVPMSPVHHTALPVPFVLAGELDRRARPQTLDPRRKIEVVGDEHRLPRWQAHDESLMPGALGVVLQDLGNDPASAD